MKMSLFSSEKGMGRPCTWAAFLSTIEEPSMTACAVRIAAGSTALRRQMPAVTWQAFFPSGRREGGDAVPNGLFVLDIDRVEDPDALWRRIVPRRRELGIRIAHKTLSTHGMRLVAECQPACETLEENQLWLATELEAEAYTKCKEWTRLSTLVPKHYFYLLDDMVFAPEEAVPFVPQNVHRAVATEAAAFEPTAARRDGMGSTEAQHDDERATRAVRIAIITAQARAAGNAVKGGGGAPQDADTSPASQPGAHMVLPAPYSLQNFSAEHPCPAVSGKIHPQGGKNHANRSL